MWKKNNEALIDSTEDTQLIFQLGNILVTWTVGLVLVTWTVELDLINVYLKVLEKKETVNILVIGDRFKFLIVDYKLPAPIGSLPQRFPMIVQPKI